MKIYKLTISGYFGFIKTYYIKERDEELIKLIFIREASIKGFDNLYETVKIESIKIQKNKLKNYKFEVKEDMKVLELLEDFTNRYPSFNII